MQQADVLSRGCVDVLPADALAKKLDAARAEGRPLRVKLGLDPTSPDIHLGHCVVLGKLREFQDAGHTAVLIVGDYTSRVGDPSGRSKTRPVLSPEDIALNAQTYQEQAFKILDEERTEVRWNGEWLSEMTPAGMFALLRCATVAQILERTDFATRMAAHAPISMLEMLYPLLQAYDSVAIEADIEFGGTDQLFNVMMGRSVMPQYDMKPQMVMTMPILRGTDGMDKMSKSLGNYVGVTDSPGDMFGKTMSIPDELMPEWYRLASGLSWQEADLLIAEIEAEKVHPNAAKRDLARRVITRFYDDAAAVEAEARFDTMFRKHEPPTDTPEIGVADLALNDSGKVFLPAMLVQHLGVQSNGEARRLITGGGVKLDGEALSADQLEVDPDQLRGTLQVGKRRFVRIV
ncbi:MAG: tyrosine--tRNA ligase [Thermoleophilia bacterium]|nr:tyrosine--tRNA ligase [Thermoleophilia bacterium]